MEVSLNPGGCSNVGITYTQHPHLGLHEVLQVLPLSNCSESDFGEKFANILALTFLHLFTKFYQNCFCG
jgi:hypothetical protein